MPLTLLLGPANCGKVAQLFDRFAEQVDAGAAPTLVVPDPPRRGAGRARSAGPPQRRAGRHDRHVRGPVRAGAGALRRAVGGARRRSRAGWCWSRWCARPASTSWRRRPASPGSSTGSAACSTTWPDRRRRSCWSGGWPRSRSRAAVSSWPLLHGAFRARLAELGIRDRAGGHGRAAELLETRLEAWDDSPVFAYGFEDMSGVQLAALRALAARCPVMVSLPYEPGRPALAAVRPGGGRAHRGAARAGRAAAR